MGGGLKDKKNLGRGNELVIGQMDTESRCRRVGGGMVAQHITEPMNHKKFEFAHGFVDGGGGSHVVPTCLSPLKPRHLLAKHVRVRQYCISLIILPKVRTYNHQAAILSAPHPKHTNAFSEQTKPAQKSVQISIQRKTTYPSFHPTISNAASNFPAQNPAW